MATHIHSNRENRDPGIERYKWFIFRKAEFDHLMIDESHIVVVQRPIYEQAGNLLNAAQDFVDLPITWIGCQSERDPRVRGREGGGITSELFP